LAPASDLIIFTALCAGLGSAAWIDIRHRRIPNVICLATAGTGLALSTTGISSVTVMSALAGVAIGLAIMLPGHIIGATGAGDVKLFAAAGALLGSGRVVSAFVFVAIAGGILALAVAFHRGRFLRTMVNTTQLLGRPAAVKAAIESPGEHNRFPYGPAIAIGCALAAWR